MIPSSHSQSCLTWKTAWQDSNSNHCSNDSCGATDILSLLIQTGCCFALPAQAQSQAQNKVPSKATMVANKTSAAY